MFGKKDVKNVNLFGKDNHVNPLEDELAYLYSLPKLYCIYDRVERKYSFPFSANTDEGAVRRMKNSGIFKDVSQSDFELYHVGFFDENRRSDYVIKTSLVRKVDWNIDVKEGVNE